MKASEYKCDQWLTYWGLLRAAINCYIDHGSAHVARCPNTHEATVMYSSANGEYEMPNTEYAMTIECYTADRPEQLAFITFSGLEFVNGALPWQKTKQS